MQTLEDIVITEGNTWSRAYMLNCYFAVSACVPSGHDGDWGGTTVTVQRSQDGISWTDVTEYSSQSVGNMFCGDVMWYRAGVKNGNIADPVRIVIVGCDNEVLAQ